ncbi:MAG: bifunctional demethylmenaquinone methyltransferase/2-methoxy-6-polyprenyl-1,4-benzoquinol methylase UbiE [Candidatus Pelagibacter sp.]
MQQNLQQKKGLVKSVFDTVYSKYDLMNDFMSFGVHRYWKRELIRLINPSASDTLVDVACGTGDIAKLFSDVNQNQSKILCVDFNRKMLSEGKKRLKNYENIKWKLSNAENLHLPSNSFDFYTISFGLRNTKNINKSIKEAYRVLKKGGRFFCLEFSKIQNQNLEILYKNYSKFIPTIGKIIVGESKPYEYLIKSIENFINQEELIEILKKNKFYKSSYKNLSGGIVSIHSGWKI